MKWIKNPIVCPIQNKTNGMRKKILFTLTVLTLCSTASWADTSNGINVHNDGSQKAVTQYSCLASIKARAKPNQVQLTWQYDYSAAYRVYRAEQLTGPYSSLGETSSNYATWLDTTAQEGKEYFYKIAPLDMNGAEICSSGSVVSKVPAHIDPTQSFNHPPYFVTMPVLNTHVGASYNYQVKALEADNDKLTYSLLIAPTDMTINNATGEINWIPTSSGTFSVNVQVTDPSGNKASQAYSIQVI